MSEWTDAQRVEYWQSMTQAYAKELREEREMVQEQDKHIMSLESTLNALRFRIRELEGRD